MLITFLASYLIWIIFLSIPILWWIDGRKLKESTLHASASSLLAWLVSQYLKDLFATTRPYILTGQTPLTVTLPIDGAFPSSHMAATTALAVSLFFHHPRLGGLFVIGSILIGAARVQAGVHYPIDIVGGAFLGLLIAIIVNRVHLFRFLKKAG